jgi:hypothetical protein
LRLECVGVDARAREADVDGLRQPPEPLDVSVHAYMSPHEDRGRRRVAKPPSLENTTPVAPAGSWIVSVTPGEFVNVATPLLADATAPLSG